MSPALADGGDLFADSEQDSSRLDNEVDAIVSDSDEAGEDDAKALRYQQFSLQKRTLDDSGRVKV